MSVVVEVLRSVQPTFLAGSIEEQRAGWDLFGTAEPLAQGVTVTAVDAGGVAAEWVHAPGSSPERMVMHLHGGGYVIGSLDSHRSLAARLSAAAGAGVLLVDYRLAPEHRFPAALDDATGAWKWLVARHGDEAALAVAGDSAGASLAVSTCVVAHQQGGRMPDALVCISPWVDLTGSGDSMLSRAHDDVVLSAQWLTAMAGHYLGDGDRRSALASPLWADLAGLPPTLIMVGTAEILYDDAIRLGRAASEAGGDVTVEEFAGAVHEWVLLAPGAPESVAALDRAGSFLQAHLHAVVER